jgi:chromate transporter
VTLAEWAPLLGHFLVLSLLSIGGVINVAPELHRLMVVDRRLVTDAQFAASIAVAQASPGPNALYVAVVGYQAAGLPGAAATLLAFTIPSSALAIAVGRWHHAREEERWLRAFQVGMAPISIALLVATAWILTADAPGAARALWTAAVALAVWRTRVHLLALMAAGAILGALGVL